MLSNLEFKWNDSFQDLKVNLAEELSSPHIFTVKQLEERRKKLIDEGFYDDTLIIFLNNFDVSKEYQNIFVSNGNEQVIVEKEKLYLFIEKIKRWSQLDIEYKEYLNLFERYLNTCQLLIDSIENSETANRVALKINDLFQVAENIKELKKSFERELFNFEKACRRSKLSMYLSFCALLLSILFCIVYYNSLVFYKNYEDNSNKIVISALMNDNNFKNFIKNEVDNIIDQNNIISGIKEWEKTHTKISTPTQSNIFSPSSEPIEIPIPKDSQKSKPLQIDTSPSIKPRTWKDTRKHVISQSTSTKQNTREYRNSKDDNFELLMKKFSQMENKISNLEYENTQMKDIFSAQEEYTKETIEKQKVINIKLKELRNK